MPFNIQNSRPFVQFPFGINVEKQLVEDFSGVTKFGYSSSVGGTFQTIWDGNSTYIYPSSAGTATVTSTDTASDDNGTVEIQGLDSNYDLATETLVIGGSAGTKSFIRVFRAVMKTATTGNANVGTLSVIVSTVTVAKITAGYGQTLMSVYTIPRNKRGYIVQLDVGTSKDLENEIRIIAKQITNGNVWNTKEFITTRGGFIQKNYIYPLKFDEKTDIEIVAKSSATSSISAGFELFLEDYH